MGAPDASLVVRQRSTGRIVAAAVGVVLVCLGSGVVLSSRIVNQQLLDAGFYTAALDEQQVYRRVYAEVLSDPDVRDLTHQLLGGFAIGGIDLADTVAVSVATTRLALPPSTLRAAVAHVIDRLTGYLRGDIDRIDATLDLSPAVVQLDETAETLLLSALELIPSLVVEDLPAYERAVLAYARQLELGRVPDAVPMLGGAVVSDDDVLGAIRVAAGVGLSDAVVNRIVSAVRAGDQREAIIIAAATFSRTYLEQLANDLASGTDLRLDLIDALGRRAGQPQQRVVEDLNQARTWAEWFPQWTALAGVGSFVTGVGLLVAAGETWRRRCLMVAAALAAAATTTWLTTTVIVNSVTSPLARAGSPTATNTLPRSVIALIAGIDASLTASLRNSAERWSIGLSLIAVVLAGVAFATRAFAAARAAGWWAISLLTVGSAALAGVAVWFVWSPYVDSAALECNGHAALCDRAFDDVVQAATHNSMSSPDVVQIWPEHDANITAQLNYGIRTLLIDTHYWDAVDTPDELSSFEQYLPPALAAYLFNQLDDRLQARPGTYLCHARCAYGAVLLATALTEIKTFLDDNPREIVTLIIQDGISTPDTESAFEASGIARYLYRDETPKQWPTLGQLIDRNERLIVFAEASGPPPAWYRPGAELIQDTAFRVTSASELSCELERGPSDASLLLLNNWIHRAAPDRADAAVVNQRDAIVTRATACATTRGQMPDFIAVNFFSIGDIIGAVDQLNGLDTTS